MNFNVSEFMSKCAIPGADTEYSKKLMETHQKNLDSFVSANKVISEGYQAIAAKQMEIFQTNLLNIMQISCH